MSGYTKHAYKNDISKMSKEFSGYIKSISKILPKQYNSDDILLLLKKYYPYEWRILLEKYDEYQRADKKLIKLDKKPRYKMNNPEKFILNLHISKNLLNDETKKSYSNNFSESKRKTELKLLEEKRLPKIKRIDNRIKQAKMRVQETEPKYFEKMMGLYDRKNTSQKDRVYIMHELTKYYSDDIVRFFKKKAHSEYNFQLREMAFKYLQQFYHYTVLRKQKYMRMPTKSKNKKTKEKWKAYAKQRYNIESIPKELVYRIENSKEQNLKHFDFFISHSSVDFDAVQSLISFLNKNNKNIYCDWISDIDYLKRNLVGDATKYVIEKRLQQSDNMIFVDSENSRKSDWVKYELNYFKNLNKSIYYLDINDIRNNNFKYKQLFDEWFYDKNFTSLKLY